MVVENLVRTESVEKIKYNYFYRLLKGKTSIACETDTIEVQSYGIEVERQDILNGELINIERDCVKNISPNKDKVHNLLELLYYHTVSPVHLVDVLGEYIDEYIIDFDKEISCVAY